MNGVALLTLLSANLALSYDTDTASPQELSEYCELEQFRPRCPHDKVIIVTEARYGLVSLGRCLQADFGYVGCFADVVDYVGAKCSGRRACHQQVPDRFMKEAAARCRPEFSGFLQAAYKCIDAGDSQCARCRSEGVIRLNTDSDGGFIGSVVVDDRQDDDGCGTSRCPWIITGRPGQVINLTLYEYTDLRQLQSSSDSPSSSRRPVSSSVSSCSGPSRRYAVVKERSNPVDASICASEHLSDHVTTRHVFTSVSYVIELRVVARKSRDVHTAFLIHYQAVGCADMSPPSNTVVRRIDDKSEVRCLLNGMTWTLQCVSGQWDGEIGDCEQPSFDVQSLGDSVFDRIVALYNMSYDYIASLHPGIVLTMLVSVIVIVVVIIVTCCFVCCRRRHYKRRYSQPSHQQTIQRSIIVDKTAAAVTPKLLRGGSAVYTDDVNKYTRYDGGCAVHRALPSLPRHMEGSWAKSVRSDASGSDASLHWDTQDDNTADIDVDDLAPQPSHSRAVRCRSVAAGPDDYSSTGRDVSDVGAQSVRDVAGYRTMPRPCVQYGVLVGDAVDMHQQVPGIQQLQRRLSRPTDIVHVRQYANISDNSVDV